MRPRKRDPSVFAWLIATASLALPWIGAGLCLASVVTFARGGSDGRWLLVGGLLAIAADLFIDFVWAHPAVTKSDQPELNQRTKQLLGRILVVEEAIEAGRGKVRVGDTLWQAEGPDAPAGAKVRVAAANATVLVVERVAKLEP